MKLKKNKLFFKLSLIFIFCCTLLFLVSCTSMLVSEDNNPRLAWESFSEYISQNDFKSAFELSANADLNEVVSNSELTNLIQKNIADNYSYKYTADTDVMGVTAWQDMDIVFLDMRKLVGKGIVRIVSNTEEHNRKYGSYRTDDEIKSAVMEQINTLVLSPSDFISTEHARVEFNYKDGAWKPVVTDDVYDILSGYSRHVDTAVNEGLEELRRNLESKQKS